MLRVRVPCSALSYSVGVVGRIATLFVVVDVDVDLWIFFLDFHLLIWNLESSFVVGERGASMEWQNNLKNRECM